MSFLDYFKSLKQPEHRLAWAVAIAAELIPGADLFPTWTAAVWFVTRQRVHSGEPEILPPGPAPERRH